MPFLKLMLKYLWSVTGNFGRSCALLIQLLRGKNILNLRKTAAPAAFVMRKKQETSDEETRLN